ncbi:MAG: hypothetical protein SFW36_24190 [Leptolyngbyaceae cyanobacterium bins.59]|nr:hypothetical protein [Leptolyngbyaceae cyanobacterium bins.59]
MTQFTLSDCDRAYLLAALRHLQMGIEEQSHPRKFWSLFPLTKEVATNLGTFPTPTIEVLDDLCLKLNGG